MKLSVFFHHIKGAAKQSGRAISEVIELVRSFGIEYLEFDIEDLKSDETANILNASGVKISSVYGFYDFGKSSEPEDAFYQCERAAELGSDKIMIIPGFYSSVDKETRLREREKMICAMKIVCEYAHKLGLVPTIEDFDDFSSPIATSEGMLDFISNVPHLKATFDTGNFIISAESEIYALEKIKPYIVHVHCKDRSMNPDKRCGMKCSTDGTELYDCPACFGCIAVAQTVKELSGSGYDGIYTIEHFGAYDQLEFIRQSAENLRSITV